MELPVYLTREDLVQTSTPRLFTVSTYVFKWAWESLITATVSNQKSQLASEGLEMCVTGHLLPLVWRLRSHWLPRCYLGCPSRYLQRRQALGKQA